MMIRRRVNHATSMRFLSNYIGNIILTDHGAEMLYCDFRWQVPDSRIHYVILNRIMLVHGGPVPAADGQ